jgi:hypothetical protein
MGWPRNGGASDWPCQTRDVVVEGLTLAYLGMNLLGELVRNL